MAEAYSAKHLQPGSDVSLCTAEVTCASYEATHQSLAALLSIDILLNTRRATPD